MSLMLCVDSDRMDLLRGLMRMVSDRVHKVPSFGFTYFIGDSFPLSGCGPDAWLPASDESEGCIRGKPTFNLLVCLLAAESLLSIFKLSLKPF
eukprot:CAMPEP_0114477524 /NCGR_PEP_ID=MMETSP0104-20121206/15413_1 /TAXON_ID=37642 ORGANISM="Paraphysomonas imperforata, Strain PA2" /NCGR_SAMPLE_ID=MMETSP0104 /ASSEMBLY_ACC=CAM_ASM_000202 /LENGTH=92 /DNA_ID=CAMNT_0001652485 /DNA_START=133 /DNA_END=408 /DNA_ORIENTATION=+